MAVLDPKPLKVTLLSHPTYPLEVMWSVWEASRHNEDVPLPREIARFRSEENLDWDFKKNFMLKYPYYFPEFDDKTELAPEADRSWTEVRKKFILKFKDTVVKLFSEDIPVTEFCTCVVKVEHMPVSLREQLVRHRVGTAQDPRIGADIVPSIVESAFWSQTTRVLNLSNFYDNGDYFVPEELDGKFVDTPYGKRGAVAAYKEGLQTIQAEYRNMLKAGIHVEDARQIIPLCFTHQISWQFNLKSLMHIVGRRSCFISQLGLWSNLIEGIVDSMAKEVDPIFRMVVNPPCIKGDTWRSCPFDNINLERIDGRDGVMAPCPLWLHYKADEASAYSEGLIAQAFEKAPAGNPDDLRIKAAFPKWFQMTRGIPVALQGQPHFPGGWQAGTKDMTQRMQVGREKFGKFWNRSVDTGERLPEIIPLEEAEVSK